MKELDSQVAYAYLKEASKLNPGIWVNHSINVAKAAKRIAGKLKNLDPDLAESYGYIHDIGRRFGVTKIKHSIDGYRFLENKGYSNAAKVCLTHSFPTKSTEDDVGEWDCTYEDYLFIKKFINTVEYSAYDRLLQLCDCLALPSGFTIVERRLIDVAFRYGITERTINRWKAFLKLQQNIEDELGYSIYVLFPEIKESVFIDPISKNMKIE